MPQFLRVWLLSIVLVGAAVSGRAATNRFEAEVQALERAALDNPPPKGAVMLYGSSSFRLWTRAAEQFPGQTIVNRGFGGAHLSDLNEFLDRLVVPAAPRLLLIYGGDNDVAAGKSPERVLADFKELVGRVRQSLPKTRIGFVAIKPSPSREAQMAAQREANRLVRRWARRWRRVEFLDVATPLLDPAGRPDPQYFGRDRLHLNAAGYERWLQVLGPYVQRRGPGR